MSMMFNNEANPTNSNQEDGFTDRTPKTASETEEFMNQLTTPYPPQSYTQVLRSQRSDQYLWKWPNPSSVSLGQSYPGKSYKSQPIQ